MNIEKMEIISEVQIDVYGKKYNFEEGKKISENKNNYRVKHMT